MYMNLSTWLIAAYLYYTPEYESFLSDAEFDRLSKELLENYDSISHMHKHLVSKESLSCQTCVGITFPGIVKNCARVMYNNFKETGKWNL